MLIQAVRRFLGRLAEAEADYDRVIALRPADFEAYRNRADLRTQTPERNHVAELRAALARRLPDWRGEVQLRFALAKELEDLGDHAGSFQELACGARLRRGRGQNKGNWRTRGWRARWRLRRRRR